MRAGFDTHKPFAKTLEAKGVCNFSDLFEWTRALPYGRNSRRDDPMLILSEGRGTCSTKHAFVKLVAMEQDVPEIQLFLGLYRMHSGNTPGLGTIIQDAGLDCIPEAHCYLKINGKPLDLTTFESDFDRLAADLISEKEIYPDQIGTYKVQWHRQELQDWLASSRTPMPLDAVWSVREACIAALSGT
jgi:hypothetical protein